MKARLRGYYDKFFSAIQKLPVGIYHYQSPPDSEKQYRLHLRIEPSGEGILIINARTVLHLNQTAVEYAYHMINRTPYPDAVKAIMRRYRVSRTEAQHDFDTIQEKIHTLIHTPELAPDIYLDSERVERHSQDSSAPYRLDCALTYKTQVSTSKNLSPTERVDRELTTEEWKTILKKAWGAGIPHVVFTGGEPTLRPDLPDLIACAEELGQVSGLLTGGYRLTEIKYLHQLLQSGLDHVMLVLDDNDGRSVEALKDILAEDIFVTVHLTISKENKTRVTSKLSELKRMGVESISLSVDDLGLKEELIKARQKVAEMGITLIWDLPVPYSHMHPIALELQEHEKPSSGAGKTWLYVEPDGDVLPEQGENHVLGNFLTDPWEKIYRNKK
jgi:organic radical activating enzyme